MRRQERKEQKRVEAQARQEARDKRTPLEQLQRLDELLGKGIGAHRERMKLISQITGMQEAEAMWEIQNGRGYLESVQGAKEKE